ncbi:serine hydrolase domain-containing protein [Ferruginibacter sp.]|nr:serine hydrolase [Ferruginibacter sp.]
MKIRKVIVRSVLSLLAVLLIGGIWYAWRAFPIISGYGSKNMCSAVFLQHRSPNDVLREDLGTFPLSLGSFTVNEKDSSVTGSVFGFAKRKTIYRKGIGCTIVNDFTEAEIKAQRFTIPAAPAINADTIAWPYGNKINDTIAVNINKEQLNKTVDYVMNEKTKDGKPTYTSAVLVLYDGKIVAEKYARGFDVNTVMLGWSMSKSLTAAMTGVLVKQGKLNVDAPAPVPEWNNTKKQPITLKQVLQQTTGLDFTEDYNSYSEVTNMLFNKGDMAAYTAGLPLKYEPGTVFNYSSGNSNILSRIIRKTVGEEAYSAFPYQSLFHKINAYSFLLEPDASGTYIGSSYSYATARDFARFGLLYYNNGKWNGEQILPDNWLAQSITPAAADKRKHYGYQFWINGLNKNEPATKWYPDVPDDMFFCDGYGGQGIYIIPSKKLVVVRLGLQVIDENKFLKEVIAATSK